MVVCPSISGDQLFGQQRLPTGHQGTLTDELDLLVVHGILHVLGMDHAEAEERRDMQALERQRLVSFSGA